MTGRASHIEWYPIDTAPKDGSLILTIAQGYNPAIRKWMEIDGKGRWTEDPELFMEEEHFLQYFHGTNYRPTHWAPLPEGP